LDALTDDYHRNSQLLRRLPTGFTATATVQIAGRGRGSNVWVSPAGALVFSTVIRHPMEKLGSAPLVFIQYLAALAVVKGIKSYSKGYENLPVKLKWPNDVCMFVALFNCISFSSLTLSSQMYLTPVSLRRKPTPRFVVFLSTRITQLKSISPLLESASMSPMRLRPPLLRL
jgi:Biotin/lipoate A/B protein ligase family